MANKHAKVSNGVNYGWMIPHDIFFVKSIKTADVSKNISCNQLTDRLTNRLTDWQTDWETFWNYPEFTFLRQIKKHKSAGWLDVYCYFHVDEWGSGEERASWRRFEGFFIKMNGLRSNLLMNMLISYAISCVINISGVIKDMC